MNLQCLYIDQHELIINLSYIMNLQYLYIDQTRSHYKLIVHHEPPCFFFPSVATVAEHR